MKTFFSDIIPRLQRYSERLDNLALLINQHWVVIDEIQNSKNVYIFRSNQDLLIAQNGKVEKGRWEYLGNNSLLIERDDESYLFRQGFFDENILALKVDGKNEYAFLVNENKFPKEVTTLEQITAFLKKSYIDSDNERLPPSVESLKTLSTPEKEGYSLEIMLVYESDKGKIEIQTGSSYDHPRPGKKAFLDGKPAPDGRYKFGFMWYVYIKNGTITKVGFF